MGSDTIDPALLIREVETLIDAASNATDHGRYEVLMQWAHEIVLPLVKDKIPEALWLYASFTHFGNTHLDQEEFDREYWQRVREAADSGNANAQFRLACELDEEPTFEESAKLFEKVAAQGHVYAQWCHGLNLLSGRGLPKDQQRGIEMIQKSADGKFEGAVKFLSEAFRSGSHGFPRDEEISARWWKKLSDKNLVRF